jgi:hypothetical protein
MGAVLAVLTPARLVRGEHWQQLDWFLHERQWAGAGAGLADGRVLLCGGRDSRAFCRKETTIFDPATSTAVRVADMNVCRIAHGATTLPDGRVMVAGGLECKEREGCGSPSRSVEVYNATSDVWTIVAPLTFARAFHGLVALSDGTVLAAGGQSDNNESPWKHGRTAELYNPTTAAWTRVADMLEVRSGTSLAALPNGKVLVAGGGGDPKRPLWGNTAELYNPKTDEWEAAAEMCYCNVYGGLVTLPDGRALMVTGCHTPPIGSVLDGQSLTQLSAGRYNVSSRSTEKCVRSTKDGRASGDCFECVVGAPWRTTLTPTSGLAGRVCGSPVRMRRWPCCPTDRRS